MLEIIIHVKDCCDGKFSWFCSVHEIFNGWWLQYGWVFLVFSQLPGIRRDCWLQSSILDIYFWGVWTCTHLFIDHHCVIFFFFAQVTYRTIHFRSIFVQYKPLTFPDHRPGHGDWEWDCQLLTSVCESGDHVSQSFAFDGLALRGGWSHWEKLGDLPLWLGVCVKGEECVNVWRCVKRVCERGEGACTEKVCV